MKNLKLFFRLQSGSTAFLLLRPYAPGKIVYFVLSTSINYNIVTSGVCQGTLMNGEAVSFEVSLTSVMPLIDKGRDVSLSFENDTLRFNDVKGNYYLEPLCVQHNSTIATQVAQKFQTFIQQLEKKYEADESLESLELEIKQAQSNWKDAVQHNLTGWVSDSNPFSSDEEIAEREQHINQIYTEKVGKLSKKFEAQREISKSLEEVDMQSLRKLADAAARYNTTVSLCDTFAVVGLPTSYLIQKLDCDTRAIQGKLLQQLLRDPKGKFYRFGDDIVFSTTEGKDAERTSTAVFILPYLPNVTVTDSLITNGSVKEKYQLNLKGMLPIISAVSDKFDTMEFDMGSSFVELTNDSGEHFRYKFDIEDAKTIELIKTMRGEATSTIRMSTISVPREIQKILGMFTDNFTIYVKSRKIIFQSGTLYAVFSR